MTEGVQSLYDEAFQSILSVGETVAVEFKRCGNGIEPDINFPYEGKKVPVKSASKKCR